MKPRITVLAACIGVLAVGTAYGDDSAALLSKMLFGMPDDIEARIAKANAEPLGSEANPVRCDDPGGERGYLNRLRCESGDRPAFERVGSTGLGPFDHIVDLYTVTCPGSEPASSEIYMDMYFPGYEEKRAVPGFTIEP